MSTVAFSKGLMNEKQSGPIDRTNLMGAAFIWHAARQGSENAIELGRNFPPRVGLRRFLSGDGMGLGQRWVFMVKADCFSKGFDVEY